MKYLSKSTIVKAYDLLSEIDSEKQQGLTQKVSALKYGSALDRYFKKYNGNCDLKQSSNKDIFASYVGEIIKINDEYCTKDFFLSITPNGRDFDCGSNFYSQSSVKDSKTNPIVTFKYPKRSGWKPVMDVKDQVLIYRADYYQDSFSFYLNSPSLRLAFVIWLLRFEKIPEENVNGLKSALEQLYTKDFCEALFDNSISTVDSSYLIFEDEMSQLEESDFRQSPKLNNLVQTATIIQTSNTVTTATKTVQSYLTALRTKPFMLLAGISGTGKSRIVRKLAQASTTQKYENTEDRWKDNRPENFELIQVKPNWHNSMDVVGYYSNVAKRYEFPPFIDFIVKAWQDLETPYFLCLDEMNLAPVEQYFAEFLSAIESRSFDADGNYVTDPIIKPFKKFGEKEGKAMLKQLFGEADPIDKNPLAVQFYEKGLTLPKNLLVMGTVNMDETTFSFSRKVLDRAMSVVMNEVDYERFFDGNTENDVAEMNEVTRKLLIDRPIRGLEAENNEANTVKEYLTNINKVLEDTPFKLGYRAANEALLYVSAAYKFNPDADIHVALDEFTMMKILSRIEGDKRSIGNLLDDLKEVITNDYPKSNEKLEKMAETLKNKQFVSYWT